MPTSRNRATTRARILSAAERVAVRDGLAAVGVNAIAAEAAVDKVLIYRYFGGLHGVLDALAAERRLWPDLEERVRNAPSLAVAARVYASELGGELRHEGSALAREITRATLRGGLGSKALRGTREPEHLHLATLVREGRAAPPFIDVEALLALLLSGVTLLALARDGSEHVFGLDPASEPDWRRIDRTLATITRALLEPGDV